jgi:hypothetical protein
MDIKNIELAKVVIAKLSDLKEVSNSLNNVNTKIFFRIQTQKNNHYKDIPVPDKDNLKMWVDRNIKSLEEFLKDL